MWKILGYLDPFKYYSQIPLEIKSIRNFVRKLIQNIIGSAKIKRHGISMQKKGMTKYLLYLEKICKIDLYSSISKKLSVPEMAVCIACFIQILFKGVNIVNFTQND
ncbi:hypothetical protein CHS0354_010791 [Potamilus streckersoni]|uniref:Uncharacterized protein n=1 Tax=Potamilus streckersoni TaxID=2493646 RepID=A0AAE0TAG5_9BIVA|nr:hypothetical protein CHS0354_010791 [Potamilus streckersoni]